MQSISRLSTLFCMGCALCSVSTSVVARDVLFAGSFCQPQDENNNDLGYGQFGPFSPGPDSNIVECPFLLVFADNLTVTNVSVTVYDRNRSENVSCTILGIDIAGNTIWSVSRSSSGSGFDQQFLVADVNRLTLGTMHMTCTIPPNQGFGLSHVTTYRVIMSP